MHVMQLRDLPFSQSVDLGEPRVIARGDDCRARDERLEAIAERAKR
jgi:hypothetical protein